MRRTSSWSSVFTGDLAWHSACAEGREVVLADEPLRRRMHGRAVQRLAHAPGSAALEGQVGATIDDAIEIVALERGITGVEFARHPLGGDDRDRMRSQMRVQRVAHGIGAPFEREIDMADLAESMHSGVGSAGALDGRPDRR